MTTASYFTPPVDSALGDRAAALWRRSVPDPDEQWFASRRWGEGPPRCTACGGAGKRSIGTGMPYRCTVRGCHKYFSVKTGTVMHSSNHDYRTWRAIFECLAGRLEQVTPTILAHETGISTVTAISILTRIYDALAYGEWLPYSEADLLGV